jgi:hypothetical protein
MDLLRNWLPGRARSDNVDTDAENDPPVVNTESCAESPLNKRSTGRSGLRLSKETACRGSGTEFYTTPSKSMKRKSPESDHSTTCFEVQNNTPKRKCFSLQSAQPTFETTLPHCNGNTDASDSWSARDLSVIQSALLARLTEKVVPKEIIGQEEHLKQVLCTLLI